MKAMLTAAVILGWLPIAGSSPEVPAARADEPGPRLSSGNTRERDSRSATQRRKTGLPRVFLIDPKILVKTRERLATGDTSLRPAADRLRHDAEKALKLGPFSIVDCPMAPPSGDKHDYVSLARYWWPNPATPNGLPYIRRDGQTNPEVEKYGAGILSRMAHAVDTLALAYYLTGDEPDAAKAAELLRTFFLAPATRMNPHFEYAQFIKGKNSGRSAGLIDAAELPRMLDSVGMLAGSPHWTRSDQEGMERWFRKLLDWLVHGRIGQGEMAAKNNHGSWCDVQVVTYALFVGDDRTAQKTLGDAPRRRIDVQIQPDGSQPLELARTKSFDYCVFNLRALFDLATLAEHERIDLWNYRSADGRGIRAALDYMVPYIRGEKAWEHEQIKKRDPDTLFPLLRRAAIAYYDPHYEGLIAKLPPKQFESDRVNLLYPPPR
jgi:hypothetical protein